MSLGFIGRRNIFVNKFIFLVIFVFFCMFFYMLRVFLLYFYDDMRELLGMLLFLLFFEFYKI